MAKFKVGDYVNITPQPDIRSTVWDSSINNYFCGKIGRIGYLKQDDDGTVLARVYVDFRDSNNPWKRSGENCAWFEGKHLIPATEYDYRSSLYLNAEYERYMVTEAKMKKRRDEIMRSIFSEPPRIDNKYKKVEQTDINDWLNVDDWNLES